MGVYPNTGYWQRPNWTFVDELEPDDYGSQSQKWLELGAQIIGGCCGIEPEHIQALSHCLRDSSV